MIDQIIRIAELLSWHFQSKYIADFLATADALKSSEQQ